MSTARIYWLPGSLQNVEDIQLYLAVHDMQSAKRWVERLHDRIMRAAAMPFSGRMVPEFEEPTIREVFEGPYRIVYKVRSGEMRILTVVHGRRQLPSLERINNSDT